MQIDGLGKPSMPGVSPDTDARLANVKRAAEHGDAKETARQFETLFATMLVREMRRSMPTPIFGEGAGADVYESWFDEHLGGALAQRDALGLADVVKSTLLRAQAAREAMQAEKTGTAGEQVR